MQKRPLIAVTMGDPAGIGPEIVVKALSDQALFRICRPLVLGDCGVLRAACSQNAPHLRLHPVAQPAKASGAPGKIDILPLSNLSQEDFLPGKPSPRAGEAMITYILRAVAMSQRGEADAMVTGPISKRLMHKAGHPFEGHTQLLARLTETDDPVMMLAGPKLRVALVTTHCSLRNVAALLNEESIYRTIRITAQALQTYFGIQRPLLAVAALNPHAGESGLFGSEEEDIIAPAINRAKEENFTVTGPLAADTIFHRAASGEFDAVVSMYHDQGLIPLKLLHFSDAVNITLGLPIVRTSVDHGTAYDIAGTGQADASSLAAAIKTAAAMARNNSGEILAQSHP